MSDEVKVPHIIVLEETSERSLMRYEPALILDISKTTDQKYIDSCTVSFALQTIAALKLSAKKALKNLKPEDYQCWWEEHGSMDILKGDIDGRGV